MTMNVFEQQGRPMFAREDSTQVFAASLQAWTSMFVDWPMAVASENLRFASRRFEAQAQHLAALGKAASVTDQLKLQSDFARSTVSAYQNEGKNVIAEVEQRIAPKAP